ncbi:MAG: DUF262 domain-containing protein, partial [Gammaproteobacteria bacterium]|nr:DUF262 domain-containing protein [Gammaproteobacteria bacterium]
MKAVEAKFLKFLKDAPQFIIPIYQRTYSWDEKQCQQLWDDILKTGRKEEVNTHFVGSIVYVRESVGNIALQSPYLVIDGQQRLTTVSLLLEALVRRIGDREIIDGFSARKLRNYYLVNPEETGDRKYKLLLSQTDKSSLLALIDDCKLPQDYSVRIKENFDFFEKKLEETENELEIICNGIMKLAIVDISLERGQDDPQLIFESLNSTGRELSQADLIRNFILMGLDPELQTSLYNQYWRPMEVNFGQEAYIKHFDSFMRHYLTVKTGEIPNIRDVYYIFKKYSHIPEVVDAGVEALVEDIYTFTNYYCAMELGMETDTDLKDAFHDIKELKVDVAYPFLLELYCDYKQQILSKDEFLKILRIVESYVFRRAICEIPTNSMNKTFARLARAVKKDKYLEGVQAQFLLLPSYRRFPEDDEFKRALQVKDLYSFRNKSYWLRRLENFGRQERVYVDDYTIEHIMPQNENLSDEWKKELGSEWERIHGEYLHRLGNLTLTGYNSSLSDRPFIKKKTIEGGFANSPLKLNKGLAQVEYWTEEEIKHRGDKLAEQITSVWIIPTLDSVVLELYKKPKKEVKEYTIENHPHLAQGPLRDLFEEFRKQVLAIDPCVTEEFLKLYVAYKAETNFVDVVPQAERLRLSL